ncbi:MAG: substrate-binding domain-containing protein, partial [Opitutales bacterium]|nr:substrate-binding domain-containing protein [Opitutales bacterium]
RIAFVNRTPSDPREPHYSRVDREAGYVSAMREAGLTPSVITIPAAPDLYADRLGHMLRSYREFLSSSYLPTAVLCESGGRVMLHAASLAGLKVPDDLSVMTFDTHASADLEVAVDRLLVRDRQMGRSAVQELCALLKDPTAPRPPVTIPFEFHRVGTVGLGPHR